MTIKTLELKQKWLLLAYFLGAKRSWKHRIREALNPKTSSPSQGWHCWIQIGCRRVPRTNSSRTYPHQTPALDCANSIKLHLNMSGWIFASHKWNFGKTMWVATRQPVTHRAIWNHSVLELGGFLFNDFSRAEWRINKIYYKTVRSCSIARVLGLNMDIRWKHLNFKTDTHTRITCKYKHM